MNIPFTDIARQYNNLREEILEITDEVYSSGNVLDGAYTNTFELAMSHRTNRKHAIAVNSCTQALILSLRTLDLFNTSHRDKILVPAQSFIATANAVVEAGYIPVFCDVDPVTGLIDINKVPVEPNEVAAVIYVNLFGNIIDYDKLHAYCDFFNDIRIPIIEDAAQSFGAFYKGIPSGKLGDISCLSFDPTKNLPNYSSGGMILTDNTDIANMLRGLRNNGKNTPMGYTGTNSRMSEADCAQMLIKLRHFDVWQQRRKDIAEYYTDNLTSVIIPVTDFDVRHANHKFVIHCSERSALQANLFGDGIETKIHYVVPMNITMQMSDELLGAESFSKTCLSLPIYPEMTDGEVECVVEAVNSYTW